MVVRLLQESARFEVWAATDDGLCPVSFGSGPVVQSIDDDDLGSPTCEMIELLCLDTFWKLERATHPWIWRVLGFLGGGGIESRRDFLFRSRTFCSYSSSRYLS